MVYQNPPLLSDASSSQKEVVTIHLGYKGPSFGGFLRSWYMPGSGPHFQDSVCLTFSLLISTFPHSRGLPTFPAALTFLLLPWMVSSALARGALLKSVFLLDAFFCCPELDLPTWASTTLEESNLIRAKV